jgi:hypothetical protein
MGHLSLTSQLNLGRRIRTPLWRKAHPSHATQEEGAETSGPCSTGSQTLAEALLVAVDPFMEPWAKHSVKSTNIREAWVPSALAWEHRVFCP